jgi:hypothetical protein
MTLDSTGDEPSPNTTGMRRSARYPGVMITQADRAAERRRVKLEEIQQQVKDGSLTIRKMTAEERKRYPPRPSTGRGRRR